MSTRMKRIPNGLVGLALAAGLGVILMLGLPKGTPETRDQAHVAVERGALLLDVRTPDEFAAGHLPGAVNVPVDQLPGRIAELGATDREVVVYCRSGNRSARAERILREKGFEQIIDLGPMSAW